MKKPDMKVNKTPKALRWILPVVLVVIWFGIGGIGGPYFGKIGDVVSNDQTTFLPASAESTEVSKEVKKFQDQNSVPAIIIFADESNKLSGQTLGAIQKTTAGFSELEGVNGQVSPPIPSKDGKAAFVVVNVASDAEYKELVPKFKTALNDANLSVEHKITGPIGFLKDLSGAFAGIDGLLLGVALAVVFVILLIVYRSPLLPILVLINSMFALCASILLVYYLAKAGVVSLNGQVQGILFILVIGAATDYALLFTARYREELSRHKEVAQAVITSWKRSLEPIVAAGGTVIAGLLCLLLSDLNSNKALGPVGAIGIALAIVATLTLLPSLLLLAGRAAFWPRIPHFVGEKVQDVKAGIWPKIAAFVQKHTRVLLVSITAALIVMSLGLFQLNADGVSQSEFVLGKSEAREGQALLNKHFPGGSGAPTQVIVSANRINQATEALKADKGVASVTPSGSRIPGTPPTIIDNEVLLEATLTDAADSEAAQATIERLRTAIREVDSSAKIGGTTAIQLDTLKTAEHDRAVVIPAVLVVITIILMVLLRSILAPLILLATTTLSFAAILGACALLFNGVFNFPGADPSVVLYGFIFLVALGIDYNIFLMTRVREESLKHGTRKGVLIGLVATGSVITSAGIVLAATFAALAVIPILFLVQLACIVALGVLIDTIVVRSLLVPAISYDIGKSVWWPSKKHKK